MSDYQDRITRRPSARCPGCFAPNGMEHLIGCVVSSTAQGKVLETVVAPASPAASLTLPTDSAARKDYPMLSGCLKYFPAALAGVSKISKIGNDKHNPGQEMHHARGKSTDHGDCILRHLTDTEDLIAAQARGANVSAEQILTEASSLVWRALAYSQELHEKYGAPLAPGARE